ncbi:DUF5085 family protein [Radiobacillus kanasensis]|uniref:DUF5085 family protein n=1 Tax=Radiobacillus kanasensis TaxID=2844358 RepID=UPI001E4F6EB4|nr:DUF5085 family protein [Radiobacillus kanasensis]UFT99210.1 DUF5085 family protein [Radiobacillus kanasensis]
MKIKRCPLTFHNVISATSTCKPSEWHHSAQDLRNAIIRNELYGTGPTIYQVSTNLGSQESAEYTFHVPVNEPVKIDLNETYRFTKELTFEDGLVIRHADLDEDMEESYQILRLCAEEYGLELEEPFYNIYLDVYGGGIIDIYAPIVKEG